MFKSNNISFDIKKLTIIYKIKMYKIFLKMPNNFITIIIFYELFNMYILFKALK